MILRTQDSVCVCVRVSQSSLGVSSLVKVSAVEFDFRGEQESRNCCLSTLLFTTNEQQIKILGYFTLLLIYVLFCFMFLFGFIFSFEESNVTDMDPHL